MAWKETGDDNISLLAAGVAFYSFLAFVPMLAAIMLIYGLVAAPADVAGHFQTLTRILPTDAAKIVADQMKGITEAPVMRTTVGLVIAILLAIYGPMRGATSVIGALNVTYDERETRNFFRTTGLSFAFGRHRTAAYQRVHSARRSYVARCIIHRTIGCRHARSEVRQLWP